MPTHTSALVAEARRLARLQLKLRKLKHEEKVVQAEIKLVKKNLRALATRDPFDQSPPLKTFGETQS